MMNAVEIVPITFVLAGAAAITGWLLRECYKTKVLNDQAIKRLQDAKQERKRLADEREIVIAEGEGFVGNILELNHIAQQQALASQGIMVNTTNTKNLEETNYGEIEVNNITRESIYVTSELGTFCRQIEELKEVGLEDTRYVNK